MDHSSRIGQPFARQRTRQAATVAGALLLLPSLGACSFLNPKTTATPYAASDGTNGQIVNEATGAAVELRNMLLVAADEDGPGTLIGVATNTGSDPVSITFTVLDGAGQSVGSGTVRAAAGETTSIGPDGSTVQVSSVPVPPGANLTLVAETPSGGSEQLTLPVLPPEGAYESVAPTSS